MTHGNSEKSYFYCLIFGGSKYTMSTQLTFFCEASEIQKAHGYDIFKRLEIHISSELPYEVAFFPFYQDFTALDILLIHCNSNLKDNSTAWEN